MAENIINELAELAIGARLRRLNDIFSKDVTKIYLENDLDFEPRHFTLFYLISQRDGIGIMEIADELSLTHPAIIHLAKELEQRDFIESVKSADDGRKRLLRISKKGKKALPVFQKLWTKIARLNKQLIKSQRNNLIQSLAEMEDMLKAESYYKRFQKLKS